MPSTKYRHVAGEVWAGEAFTVSQSTRYLCMYTDVEVESSQRTWPARCSGLLSCRSQQQYRNHHCGDCGEHEVGNVCRPAGRPFLQAELSFDAHQAAQVGGAFGEGDQQTDADEHQAGYEGGGVRGERTDPDRPAAQPAFLTEPEPVPQQGEYEQRHGHAQAVEPHEQATVNRFSAGYGHGEYRTKQRTGAEAGQTVDSAKCDYRAETACAAAGLGLCAGRQERETTAGNGQDAHGDEQQATDEGNGSPVLGHEVPQGADTGTKWYQNESKAHVEQGSPGDEPTESVERVGEERWQQER